MQASAKSEPHTGNPAQKNDEPATQLRRELQDLAVQVANMEKDLALQPMAANGIQSGIFGAHVLECGKASQYFSKYSGAGHIAGSICQRTRRGC